MKKKQAKANSTFIKSALRDLNRVAKRQVDRTRFSSVFLHLIRRRKS